MPSYSLTEWWRCWPGVRASASVSGSSCAESAGQRYRNRGKGAGRGSAWASTRDGCRGSWAWAGIRRRAFRPWRGSRQRGQPLQCISAVHVSSGDGSSSSSGSSSARSNHDKQQQDCAPCTTYHRIARQRHWPRRGSPWSRRLGPCYSMSSGGCRGGVGYLSARAAGAAPTRAGGRGQAQARWGRCSRPWRQCGAGGSRRVCVRACVGARGRHRQEGRWALQR
jgi:hypothetical protein